MPSPSDVTNKEAGEIAEKLALPHLPHNLLPGHPVYDSPHGLTSADRHHLHPGVIDARGSLVPGTKLFYTLMETDFKVQDDDVWLVTYPKSGTSLTWQILVNLLGDGNEQKIKDLEDKMRSHSMNRIELHMFDEKGSIDKFNQVKAPRIFGSHLPEECIPTSVKKNSKVIVVMRNPKDVCVSYYHFHRMNRSLGHFKGTFSQFYEAFITDQACYGSWFEHTLNWWNKHKHDANFLFLHFEDILEDRTKAVKKLCQFLGRPMNNKVIEATVAATKFDNMKESMTERLEKIENFDLTISHFLRKGQVGDWRNHFTVNESEHFDAIYREKMKDVTDLKFRFE